MIAPFFVAFCIWMLLTAELSWVNAVIGLAASAMVLPLNRQRLTIRRLLQLVLGVLILFPRAFLEAFLMVLFPHRKERFRIVEVADPQDPWAVFYHTFLITFTPRSLVTDETDGILRVHELEREKRSCKS